ncbi:Protein of unknown function [Pyronema omphalodes CBS 100304]|uniref:Uncharacterized protein n=1 Tax=Pyronema omphalodes (strain CBS 100304) TaxID=1076935 RepID=U4KU69_PYROM|nr:Protein of unknown function [Pyronema omphalodes CBS 100304]
MSNLTIGARNLDGVHANLHEEFRYNATFDQRTAYDILWHCATHANIVFEWNGSIDFSEDDGRLSNCPMVGWRC